MKDQYIKGVTTLELDKSKCMGCGMCLTVCPHGVFSLENGKSNVKDKDSCMECGACARNCPFSAIEVKSGVGCAYALLKSKVTGGSPECGCSENKKGGCCG